MKRFLALLLAVLMLITLLPFSVLAEEPEEEPAEPGAAVTAAEEAPAPETEETAEAPLPEEPPAAEEPEQAEEEQPMPEEAPVADEPAQPEEEQTELPEADEPVPAEEEPAEGPAEEPEEYPWVGLSDTDFVAWILAAEHADYIKALCEKQDEEYICFEKRLEAIDDAAVREAVLVHIETLLSGEAEEEPAEEEEDETPTREEEQAAEQEETELPGEEDDGEEESKALLSEEIASGSCGTHASWVLTDDGLLRITGTGAMKDDDGTWSSRPLPWYDYRTQVINIVIEDGITHIGQNAFLKCSNAVSVSIPDSVTSIGFDAFCDCESLTDIHIPKNVSVIEKQAFCGCTALTSLTVSTENPTFYAAGNCIITKGIRVLAVGSENSVIPDGVTAIGDYAFTYHETLSEITIPESVTSIGDYAFWRCTGLRVIDIPSSVKSIGACAFCDCSRLGWVSLPEDLESLGESAFSGCSALRSVTIPSGVTSIKTSAFSGCSSLSSVTLPAGLTSIAEYAFFGCPHLTSIIIPAGVSEIEDYAFGSKLQSVFFTGHAPFSIAPHAFSLVVASVYFPADDSSWTEDIRQDYDGTLTWVPLKQEADPATSGTCGDNATWSFQNGILTVSGTGKMTDWALTESRLAPWNAHLPYIKEIVIGPEITRIGAYAFYGCPGKLTLPDTSALTGINTGAFWGCSGITSLRIPASVTNIANRAFARCENLSEITFAGHAPSSFAGDSFADVMTTVYYLLSDASWTDDVRKDYGGTLKWRGYDPPSGIVSTGTCGASLTWTFSETGVLRISGTGAMDDYSVGSIYNRAPWDMYLDRISEIVMEHGVTDIGDFAFYHCQYAASVTIPSSVKTIGQHAFEECNSLMSVAIPSSVTTIGESAFRSCSSLKTVTIPAGVTSLGNYAFMDCSGLQSAIIYAKNVTSNAFHQCGLENVTFSSDVQTIERDAFNGCSKLRRLTIPASVTSIGEAAFSGCRGLVSIAVEPENTKYYAEGNCLIRTADKTLILGCKNSVIPSDVTTIEKYAFYACSELTGISIPPSVQEIRLWAFAYCTGLKDICIPAGACIGKYVFHYCSGLTSVTFAGNLVIEERAFENTALETVIFRGMAPSNVSLNTFKTVTATVYYPVNEASWTQDKRQNYGGTLTWIPYDPNAGVIASGTCGRHASWKLTDEGVLTISGTGWMTEYTMGDLPWAAYTQAIKEVRVEEGITSLSKFSFYGCTGLGTVTLPSSLTEIGASCFNGCAALTRISIPRNITLIPYSCFEGCVALTSLTVSENLQTVQESAFCDCHKLIEVHYGGTREEWRQVNIDPFENTSLLYANLIVSTVTEYIVLKNETGETLPDEMDIDRALTDTYRLVAVTEPEDADKPVFSSSDPAVATVDKTGLVSFRGFGEVTITAQAGENVSASVTFDVYDSSKMITLSHSYILLKSGKNAVLTAWDNSKGLSRERYAEWSSSDESIATVAGGVVHAVGKSGTAYITAELEYEGYRYSAECRVDVYSDPEEEITGVQLVTTSASVNVYRSSDYPTVTVLPLLSGNLAPAAAGDTDKNAGVAITEARFELEKANDYFRLRVKDDRTLEIVPKEEATEAALRANKALLSRYTSKLIIKVAGTEYKTAASLKLTVQKTKPVLKAGVITLSSYEAMLGTPYPIEFTNGTVISAETTGTVPDWLVFDAENLTLSLSRDNIPGRYRNGTLKLNCEAAGWRIPATASVTYKIKKTAPKLTFTAKSGTVLPESKDVLNIGYTVSPAELDDPELFPVTVKGIEEKSGRRYVALDSDLDCLNAFCSNGILSVHAPKYRFDGKAHTYRVVLGILDKTFTVTVTTPASSAKPGLTLKQTGGIRTKVAGSTCVLTAVPKNFHAGVGEEYRLEKIMMYKGSSRIEDNVSGLFTVSQAEDVFTISEIAPGTLQSGYSFRAVIGVYGVQNGVTEVNDTDTATLKITFDQTVPAITAGLKKTGSLDITRPESMITLTPTVTNWTGEKTLDLQFYNKAGEVSKEDAPFTCTEQDGVFLLRVRNGWTAATSEYSVILKVTADSKSVYSNSISLPIKKGTVKVTSNVSSVVLYKQDRYSRAAFTLSIGDATVSAIDHIALDAASEKKFRLVDLGNNTWALEYRDNTLPSSFRASTVKLSVFVQSCGKAAATVNIKVSYK